MPLENAIDALNNLFKYRPYDRSIRLKRSALWKALQNRQNALIGDPFLTFHVYSLSIFELMAKRIDEK